jgi:hypothetical protein
MVFFSFGYTRGRGQYFSPGIASSVIRKRAERTAVLHNADRCEFDLYYDKSENTKDKCCIESNATS